MNVFNVRAIVFLQSMHDSNKKKKSRKKIHNTGVVTE